MNPPTLPFKVGETGIPPVEKGERASFWCYVEISTDWDITRNATKSGGYVCLEYFNQYDPCYDETSPNLLTGWFEPLCQKCEGYWRFKGQVLHWFRLPEGAKE